MKIIHYFTGTDDPASNRRAVFCVLLAAAVFVGIVVFRSASTVSAADQPSAAQTGHQDQLLQEQNVKLAAELSAALEKLAAAEAERDALLVQAEAASAEAGQARRELEALRQANATSYVLRFRVERNVKFPEDSEILYFTRTVDADSFARFQVGSVVTGSLSFLTTPGDGLLHEWVVVLEDKYVAVNNE